MTIALIIPTLNAGPRWIGVLEAIKEQTIQPNRKILIDSSSDDQTALLAKQHGFEVHAIQREDFNPGLTRQAGANLCNDADILIYMTQDATPADPHTFEALLQCFNHPQTAAAYGRHLPRPEADAAERFPRLHLYPKESLTKTAEDIPNLGLQTAFCSNSFAAWRRCPLEQIGGFPETAFGEDMLAAAKLILAGHSVTYCAKASVVHSHTMTLREAFARGRQIGQLHREHPWLCSSFGHPEHAGTHFLSAGLRFMAKESPQHIPFFVLHSAAKFFGFRSGKTGVY